MSNAEDLKKVEDEILSAELPLQDTARNLVFGRGNPEAKAMLIGEAPGKNEDIQGEPFVGAAGHKLETLLERCGIPPDAVYIANILKYRPPDNRNPKQAEIQAHGPFLLRQIEVIQPRVIITLGNFASKFIVSEFKSKAFREVPSIGKLHGKKIVVSTLMGSMIILPTYHPAATLYNPSLLPELEGDLEKVANLLSQ